MTEKQIKYIFYLLAAGLLVFMLASSRQAGISCDEVLHYNHSIDVYDYFATHGADTSALHTPVTNLRHYGQSYDNIVTILARWLKLEDIYTFRHLMSSLAGWLVIIITSLFAVWLGTYRHGITVLLLFAISPTFIGHSWNNLKDVPFALGYIASIFFMLRFIFHRKKTDIILLTLSMAFILSIRAGGLIVFCYLILFTSISFIRQYMTDRSILLRDLANKFLLVAGMITVAWFLSIIDRKSVV